MIIDRLQEMVQEGITDTTKIIKMRITLTTTSMRGEGTRTGGGLRGLKTPKTRLASMLRKLKINSKM